MDGFAQNLAGWSPCGCNQLHPIFGSWLRGLDLVVVTVFLPFSIDLGCRHYYSAVLRCYHMPVL